MGHLTALNKYFWKYRKRFFSGILFIAAANYFAIIAPQLTAYVVNKVQMQLPHATLKTLGKQSDPLVNMLIHKIESTTWNLPRIVAFCGLTILVLAIVRGVFMFLMRQTIIVMSRHIEYDQKNEVYHHYQKLDSFFYKAHTVGDLMNRISEDVSRVRQYTGPAIMYLVNLITVMVFAITNMFAKNVTLTLYTLAPLPLLAIIIYKVNNVIHHKSEQVQERMSELTTQAQQSYSGIRVIKSYGLEDKMLQIFTQSSLKYRRQAIGLAKVDAYYFPAIQLLIGISTLVTILIGCLQYINGEITEAGTIVEFVLYINMLAFPVSAIGWVASMIQRASASQKRLNEFLQWSPAIVPGHKIQGVAGSPLVEFSAVSYKYDHTGIVALSDFNLTMNPGEKVAILGKTGAGKSTVAQLLLRFYDATEGTVNWQGINVKDYETGHLRKNISYVPQEVFLFSDTVFNNIRFGQPQVSLEQAQIAAHKAFIAEEISRFDKKYDTKVGERGITLSGGQKQRISLARALVSPSELLVLDDSLSAVDVRTEQQILANLQNSFRNQALLVITHRIFSTLQFDKILVMQDGRVVETGTHHSLLQLGGLYAGMYELQQKLAQIGANENLG